MDMDEARGYKSIMANGITAVIINRGRVLLLKRRSLPFLKNAGIWSFLFGHREEGERYLATAYREIDEEVGLEKESLTLLEGNFTVGLFDPKKRLRWQNRMFIFRSDSDRVRKDFENAAYRWARFSDVMGHKDYQNIFIGEERILKRINRYIDE